MSGPLVSIIVVSYNHTAFVVENLNSIKKQTYTNIEWIIADDASKDNSVEIIKNWLYENQISAKTNFHTINTGLATTLNECMELTTGKYVKCIAADDFLHPEAIQKCVAKLEACGEKFGLVYTDMISIDANSVENSSRFASGQKEKTAEEIRQLLLEGNCIPAPSVLMNTNAWKSTGAYSKEILTEDYDRWLRINQNYEIAYIPEILVYYRDHDGNISKEKAERIATECLQLRMKYDTKGKVKENIAKELAFQKFRGIIKPEVVESYRNYPHRSGSTHWYIEGKIPLLVFRILKKLGF